MDNLEEPTTDEKILATTGDWITTYKLASGIGVSWGSVKSHCLELVVKGLLQTKKEDGKNYWKRVKK